MLWVCECVRACVPIKPLKWIFMGLSISLFLFCRATADISFLPGNKTKMEWEKLIWLLVSRPFFSSDDAHTLSLSLSLSLRLHLERDEAERDKARQENKEKRAGDNQSWNWVDNDDGFYFLAINLFFGSSLTTKTRCLSGDRRRCRVSVSLS